MSKMKKTILLLSLFTLIIGLVTFLLNKWDETLVYNHIIYFIIYYYIVSFLSISFINFAVAKNKDNFMLFYLGSIVTRFFLSIILAFLFMIFDKPNITVIGINFVILHLLFLGLDLFIIINKVKSISSKDQDLNVGQSS